MKLGYNEDEKTDVRPLSDEEISRLDTNLPSLLTSIEPDELLVHLYAKRCISSLQNDHIAAKPTCHEKIIELISILVRRSYADFKLFIDILKETKQGHVAEVITHGGGRTADRI